MKRTVLTIAAAALAAAILPQTGNAIGSFDKRLSSDQQILQALNRMTYGPRPGDIEEVKRIGLKKWIDLQLHPDQIPENPVLADKLKPLATISMKATDIVQEYSQPLRMMQPVLPPQVRMNQILTPEERRQIMNGTAEVRTAMLKTLDPERRKIILAGLPEDIITYTPEFKDEAEKVRKEFQEEQQAQIRKNNPQLRDLFDADQMKIVNTGDRQQLLDLLNSLDPDKRALAGSRLPPRSQALVPEFRREARKQQTPRQVPGDDAREAKVFRAVYSNRQLEEVLVDFWFNHFNVDINKNLQRVANMEPMIIESYERDAIRPHVFGHFKDLLLATARHPAMLYYLDNWESVAPDTFGVGPYAPIRATLNGVPNSIIPSALQREAHGLNENYGREVMELHTLGVKGGYTQDDVRAVARCFTGWTVRDSMNPEFVFAKFMHADGEKVVLGHKIPAGGGEQDGLTVIDILAHHPSTAKFISFELARHFVADNPPPALVDRMARVFLKTDGDLREVMDTMFKSPEFFSEGAFETRIKSPLEMVVSTVRAMNADVTDTFTLVQRISEMGEPLYGKLEPNGYPDAGEAWLSTAGMITRMNFPTALASDKIPGAHWDTTKWKDMPAPEIARDLLGHDPSPQTMNAIETGLQGKAAPPSLIASLVLSSPDFERR